MKKWWIWAALAALLLGIGILAGRSYLANREKAKRQKELWEKMESVTQDQTAEAEIMESVDPATLEGYLYAKELAALEEACEHHFRNTFA